MFKAGPERFYLGVAFLLSAVVSADAGALPMPAGKDLAVAITNADADLFGAYNACDLKKFASYIAPDIEFYHDKGGLTVGRAKLVESIKNNICGKLRRVLTPGSLQVDEIPGYGAVETGAHRFCELHTGNCDATALFVQLWKYQDGAWLLTRVISYDHHIENGASP